jgi:signal transduction histidine kinase
MIYVAITFVVLVILNIYCSAVCKRLFYQNKESALVERAQIAAAKIDDLDVLTPSAVNDIVTQMSSLKVTQLIIADQSGVIMYDSMSTDMVGQPASHDVVATALECNDVFTWNYHDGVMRSEAAVPVISYGITAGCVYMMEIDAEQGALMKSLHLTILTITLLLELLVIIFSIVFSYTFSQRLNRITNSMRIIQEGDYSHKVILDGHDELSFLGDEFNDLTERLQTSENKRRQFVSDASHELKTPLASIKLLSDSILQNDMDVATIREFVGDIGDEADRLNRMTQKLLDLTRCEDVQNENLEIIYMAPTVERVVRMLSTQAEKSGIQIELDLANDAPILIREDDLYQIVFNLAENGIKYNLPNGKLTISLSRNEEYGILKVSDTGTGIPEDSLSHIFERFYRVDKARSQASGGSGLGLSIVRNMVLRNQGQIHVESTFGLGTTFTVEFPAFDTEEELE